MREEVYKQKVRKHTKNRMAVEEIYKTVCHFGTWCRVVLALAFRNGGGLKVWLVEEGLSWLPWNKEEVKQLKGRGCFARCDSQ